MLAMNLETKTNVGASATIVGRAYDIFSLNTAQRIRAMSYVNVAGTLSIEQSYDNVTFRVTTSSATTANTVKIIEDMLMLPYARVKFVNGATGSTTFEMYSAIF